MHLGFSLLDVCERCTQYSWISVTFSLHHRPSLHLSWKKKHHPHHLPPSAHPHSFASSDSAPNGSSVPRTPSYPWKLNGSIPPATNSTCDNVTIIGKNIDLPGSDLGHFGLNTTDYTACQQLCCDKLGCESFLFQSQSDYAVPPCSPGKPCCFLKNSVPKPVPKPLPGVVVAGRLPERPSANYTAPPMGTYADPPAPDRARPTPQRPPTSETYCAEELRVCRVSIRTCTGWYWRRER